MTILVTGGTGYIGSHTVVQLIKAGHAVVVLDNLSNSNSQSIKRISSILGIQISFVNGDVRDRSLLKKLFMRNNIDTVIHFAGLKSVKESLTNPLMYYENNVSGTLILLKEMLMAGIKKIIFSSSATVYGVPEYLPLDELHSTAPLNSYGQTKLTIENILKAQAMADTNWSIGILRYFNPIGAHLSGAIGENPIGIPNNINPYLLKVAAGELPWLPVYGGYDTFDGTGVRDYIHVEDLSAGHLSAVKYLKYPGIFTVNLGTGRGTSVLELIAAYEKACGKKIPYKILESRQGDLSTVYANVNLAKTLLGWSAKYDLERMCVDSWRWQSKNPKGYDAV
jgi:UDP-glucose 4-epimerase